MNESDIVFRYTRAMAIADGVLIDATLNEFAEVTKQHLPSIHVAMTDSVHHLIGKAVADGADYAGCWHAILWMSRQSVTEHLANGRTFTVGLRDSQRLHWHNLKILFHPGDHGEPCATVMQIDED